MTRPLNFRQIEVFRAVMQTGTATAAAAMLHTTQPSISRMLGQIQGATGLRLFELRRGRLQPTPEAMHLYATVQRHFIGLERVEQDVSILRRSGTGRLGLACTPALGLSVMPAVLARFTERHPGVHVSLQTLGAVALREGLVHGLHDLVLTTTPLRLEPIDVRVLHRSEMVVVVPPGHRLARRREVRVEDLSGEVLVALNADDPIQQDVTALMRAHAVQPSSTLETTYSATICAMVAQGIGVAVVNPYMARAHADRVRMLPLRPALPVEVCVARPAQAAASRNVLAFIDMLEAYFAGEERRQAARPR